MLKTLVLTSVLALTLVNTAAAEKAYSWNLSSAMTKHIDINSKGVWAFMQNTTDIDDPANYTLLPDYSSICFGVGPMKCWRNTGVSFTPIIGIATETFSFRGVKHTKYAPLLHPGQNVPVIIRWQSPIDGKVNISGRISAIDRSCCGDGVNWALKNNSAAIIRYGHLNQGQGAAFTAQDIAIGKGENLYFSVDMNDSITYDSTRLDLLISSLQ